MLRRTWAFGLNQKGQVAGIAHVKTESPHPLISGEQQAFLYSDGVLTGLGSLGGPGSAVMLLRKRTINNSGEVAGLAFVADRVHHGFLYKDGKMIDLGTLGGTQSMAEVINDQGWVAGWSDAVKEGKTYQRLFLYKDGKLNDLGPEEAQSVKAQDMNNKGEIIGTVTFSRTDLRGFVYRDGKIQYLEGPGGERISPTKINEAGVISGTLRLPDTQHAILYKDGKVIDLHPLFESIRPSSDLAGAAPSASAGDVNGDGKVSMPDVILALRMSVGSLPSTSEQQAALDLNGDSRFDLKDVLLLLRRVVGL